MPVAFFSALVAALLVLVSWSGPAPAQDAPRAIAVARLAAPAVGQPDAARVLAGDFDAQFNVAGSQALRLDRGPFWLRVAPVGAADPAPGGAPRAFVLRYARGATATLYQREREPLTLNAYAAGFPRDRARNALVFPLDEARAGDLAYFWIEPGAGVPNTDAVLNLESLADANAAGMDFVRVISFAVGALFALALSTLCIWVVTRDRPYLYFAGTVGFEGIWLLYASGEGYAWPGFALLREFGAAPGNAGGAFSVACLCLFMRAISKLHAHAPRLMRALGAFALAFAGAGTLHLFVPPAWLAPLAVPLDALLVAAAACIVAAAAIEWRNGARLASYLLFAWVFVLAVIAWGVVCKWLGRPPPALLVYGFPFVVVAASIALTIGLADRMRAQTRALLEARRHAETDPLTGVLSRRSIVDRLHATVDAAHLNRETVGLLFVDLDHFKAINDTYGHLAGDACLRAIVAPIQGELRHSDAIGRYGGEEFLVVLHGANDRAALAIAERIRTRVAEVVVNSEDRYIALTCSIGVASSESLPLAARSLLAEADRAVYAAKNAGRNRVELAARRA